MERHSRCADAYEQEGHVMIRVLLINAFLFSVPFALLVGAAFKKPINKPQILCFTALAGLALVVASLVTYRAHRRCRAILYRRHIKTGVPSVLNKQMTRQGTYGGWRTP